ncbi:MAG: hypothetical protein COX79_03235 [Candidatus Levybacteria bacterium CG_4_10_14_0_2_um_filter_36_16]|nr:MAG: hypothetical protein AUK12_05275 [Candidatus Levybacteria bacterium CG2_30_37_29]PIR79447.1 MAG: hypothetical protein COU26_01075 [Candidatus Levybacteria bacterium CG10_big_fil_rev_8_21_14_0_10_36_30]PIZ97177.1 MAG: hypothetical protein COX79_03235 [Candidatus Levybacteria bacterium CG_4_10_14_0_2_um_filter_36_16]PJA90184.1 MAG: hypothetical protein CO136_02900 [Candidatus Levybacteria bacterium CG_4_9_14_3_um_filter_36_7]
MRGLLKDFTITGLSIYFTSLFLSGLVVKYPENFFTAAIIVLIIHKILNPIFSTILFPLKTFSFGLVAFVPTIIALLIASSFFKVIVIKQFTFPSIHLYAVNFNSINLSPLLSFLAISATIYLLIKLQKWLFGDL